MPARGGPGRVVVMLASLCGALCAALAADPQPQPEGLDKVVLKQTPLDEEDAVPGLGRLRGSLTHSFWQKRPVYQYQGVPYAQPPSGARRFLPPEPAEPWDGVLDATKLRRRCPQLWHEIMDDDQPFGPDEDDVEDCLFLNVYTPMRPPQCNRSLPVMFYIHGGSWRIGSAKDYKPHYLLDKDVVLVVIQYRLGPLGFLSLQSDSVPGNVGLMDQLLALKWVHQHIRHFCGDTDNVTIFGASSGAAAVTLFMISPLVDSGLFQRVIFQSGSARCTWYLDERPTRTAREIAAYANCTSTDVNVLAACLRAVTPWALLSAHNKYLYHDLTRPGGRATGGGGNHAVVQKAGTQRFLVEHPRVSLQYGRVKRVPVMGGVTMHEGSYFFGNIYDLFLLPDDRVNDADFLRHNLTRVTLEFSGIDDHTGTISDIFREKYFKESDLGTFALMAPGLIDICSVALLKGCTFRMVQENSRQAPSFLYTFNFKGRHTKYGGYGSPVDYPYPGGIAHSDDLIYLFPEGDSIDLNEEEDATAQTMVELWTNFATFGKPAPASRVSSWSPVSTEYGPYLSIGRVPRVRDNFLDEYTVAVREGLDGGAAVALGPTAAPMLVLLVLLAGAP